MIIEIIKEANDSHNIEIIISICAIIISIVSIFLGVSYNRKTFNHVKNHDKLSTSPIIEILSKTDDKANGGSIFTIDILNEGFGPALIKSVTFKENDNDSIDAIRFCEIIKTRFGLNNQLESSSVLHLFNINPLGGGKELRVLEFNFRAGFNKDLLIDYIKTVKIKIKYSNIYKDNLVYNDFIADELFS